MTALDSRAVDEAAARLAIQLVSYALGVPAPRIEEAPRGAPDAAFSRQLAMYLCHVAFAMSGTRVGVAFRRDRSTACHAFRVVEDRRENALMDSLIAAMEETLRAAPAPHWRAELGLAS